MIETLGRFLENVRATTENAVIEAETALKLSEIYSIISISILVFILICVIIDLCIRIKTEVMTEEMVNDTKEMAEYIEVFSAGMTEKMTKYNSDYDEVLERVKNLENFLSEE